MDTRKRQSKRILLIDNQPICRHGLERVLRHNDSLVIDGRVSNLNGALALHSNPALIALDLAIAKSRGIASIKDLKRRFPNAAILILTAHDESLFAERCLKAGASGFVMKTAEPTALELAFTEVANGQLHISDRVRAKLLSKLTGQESSDPTLLFDRLSDRELLIVQHISLSKNNSEIAEELQISTKTIESHRSRIKSKLELASPSELVRFATRLQSALF